LIGNIPFLSMRNPASPVHGRIFNPTYLGRVRPCACYSTSPLNGVNNNDHNHDDDQSVVYVEIGANIGSCVMEMLLSTNASIVAFEPHPRNLYNLKKTVSLLDETYQNRLALFPVGPGNASMTSTIYSGSDNLGVTPCTPHLVHCSFLFHFQS